MLRLFRTRLRWIAILFVVSIFLFLKPSLLLPTKQNPPIKLDWQHSLDHSNQNPGASGEDTISAVPLPSGTPKALPQIQYDFGGFSLWDYFFGGREEDIDPREAREQIKSTFLRSWQSYRDQAWAHDEVAPIFGGYRDTSRGSAATLIGALDTLWIMNLNEEFDDAVEEIRNVTFAKDMLFDLPLATVATQILGGLLGAYDVSRGKYPVLLNQARNVGDLILDAFNTTNGMPTKYAEFQTDENNVPYSPVEMPLTDIGSIGLELIRLTQLSGDSRYYSAANRVIDALQSFQDYTSLPGLWPDLIDASRISAKKGSRNIQGTPSLQSSTQTTEDVYSLGSGLGSVYATLLKQHILLGQQDGRLKKMYNKALSKMKEELTFYPLAGNAAPSMKMTGNLIVDKQLDQSSDGKHVFESHVSRCTCSSGAMVALSARTLKDGWDLSLAKKLTRGCDWAHETSKSGIMPAEFMIMKCTSRWTCSWDGSDMHDWWDMLDIRKHTQFDPNFYLPHLNFALNKKSAHRRRQDAAPNGHYDPLQSQTVSRPEPILAHEDFARERIWEEGLAEGMLDILSKGYDLQWETIESMFTLYRITGDEKWRRSGWRIFEAIDGMTASRYGNARLVDTSTYQYNSMLEDTMPSWWLSSTLKYFYLLFSDPELVSLDDYVFNAEGHPFKLPRR